MSNESIDLTKSHSNIDLELFGGNNPPDKSPTSLEAAQKKPKRKYTKRKQKSEDSKPDRVGCKPTVLGSEGGGSTVRLERQRRKRFDKLQQELAAKLGELPEGFPATTVKIEPGSGLSSTATAKPRKNKVRTDDCRKEIDVNINDESENDSESDSDFDYFNNYGYLLGSYLPFLRTAPPPPLPQLPQESAINKIVSAFVGYPVETHLSQTSPSSSKLIIEIEI